MTKTYTFSEALPLMLEGKQMLLEYSGNQLIYTIKDGRLVYKTDLFGGYNKSLNSLEECLEMTFTLYEEPGRDFKWALDQLISGHKVKRKCWSDIFFYILKNGTVKQGYTDNSSTKSIFIFEEDMRATDWVLA